MFLILITLGLNFTYFGLYVILPALLNVSRETPSKNAFYSILSITLISFTGYLVAFNIRDIELGNRVLHGFGGGFVALLTCFFAVKDMKLKITKFQFAFISFMIVMCLGIGNEIFEFILQNTTRLVFAESINDTWLDLVSNLIGSIIALSVVTPFIHQKRKRSRETVTN